jgi:acyl-CoA thioester hydrolase
MTHKHRILVHTSRQSMRWGDMDALGHVNNTVYFRYMEQARIEWLSATLPGQTVFGGTGPVIVNASCTFIEPLVYPGDFDVLMYLSDPGRSSVGSSYDIVMGGRTYAEGAAKIVWIDYAAGRSTPLPEVIVARLRAAQPSAGAAAGE